MGRITSLLCLSLNLSDDGGRFLHLNPLQGASNGKEEKESSKEKAAPKRKKAAPKRKKAAPKKKKAAKKRR